MSTVHAIATTGGLHTVLGDLDAAVRALFERELGKGAGVSFDTPTAAWAEGLAGPANTMYLYDVMASRS